MIAHPSRIFSYDTETHKFRAGWMAPPIVCASAAKGNGDGRSHGELVIGQEAAVAKFREIVAAAECDPYAACAGERSFLISFANDAYDLAALAEADPTILPLLFRLARDGNIYDILLAQTLDAIYGGHLGLDPRTGSELRRPSDGKVTKRYSLDVCTDLVLGRVDAKANDVWRTSYALLQGVLREHWPYEARTYPVDDAVNQRDVAVKQVVGRSSHEWLLQPAIPGIAPPRTACRHCDEERTLVAPSPECPKAMPQPHRNLGNLPAQVEAALALWLGACHSMRTDPLKVEALAKEVEGKSKVAVERFQKKGWIREDGTEDTCAVKRAVATAYGAEKLCPKCNGGCQCRKCEGRGHGPMGVCKECDGAGVLVGHVQKIDVVECRGEKVKGRYQGCSYDGLGGHCAACSDTKTVKRLGSMVTCKNVFDEGGAMIEAGCDGSGFDLSAVVMLPRTEKFGISTDRDTKMESGDEEMADYGDDEFTKSLVTYLPYLRTGIDRPLKYMPNVLVATGRCSYEDSPLHQMPRQGHERECIRARGVWCNYPVEMVLGSTDYEAGELVTLSQLCYWLFDYSQMRDAINSSGKPGILHSDLAAEVLGISLDEFLVRLKAKDKQAVDFRQMCKPINFGLPGGMGVAKLVLTSRKKNAGFSVCEDGPARNKKGEPGYWGVRFCVLTGGAKQCGAKKVLDWRGYPCAPTCEACLRVVYETLKPAYFRRYPEIRDYHKWVQKKLDDGELAPSCVWDAEAGKPRVIRERGGCDFSAFANNGFQSMLADIGKHAFVTATRECYLGVKDDGSPSPLAGCRLPLYLHDEPLSELILATAHESGPRIADIMMESGRMMAPDVTWKAQTALCFWWNKAVEEKIYKSTGRLMPWGPIPDYLQHMWPEDAAA